VTKTGTVMDGSMQSQLLASVFSMASMIELSCIRERTKEGLQRARSQGKRLGRPPGKTGRLKLDGQVDAIKGYIAIGLPKRRMAKALGVAYNTLARFIECQSASKIFQVTASNFFQLNGMLRRSDRLFCAA